MHRLALIALASSVFAIPLNAQTPQPAPAVAAEPLPSIALPSNLDRVLRDYERAWRANDIPALVALFTEDGFVLQPGRPPARGRAALANVYRGQTGGVLRLRALAYAAGDSVAYIIGAYSYGDAQGDQGKFTLTLRRAGGQWLIASDMDSGNQQRRPQPPPT
ncbi:MAG TPA: nuclear transport factor 2 family protein [Gemmatimonadaceae bacterium]|nr:nuclear transport factor 2 family protein [Gemmatimonadaceae bacterium]